VSREPDDAAPAILHTDTGRRLDAIIRRHGGQPKPDQSGKMALPSPGRRKCKGQLALLNPGDEAEQ
jgi:hypothetical protein